VETGRRNGRSALVAIRDALATPTAKPACARSARVSRASNYVSSGFRNQRQRRVSSIGDRMVSGNAWAAANLYEELCRLSDAELERRGIPRGELHRCVFEASGPPSVRVWHGDRHRHSPNAVAGWII
jgi:hypothetical protein